MPGGPESRRTPRRVYSRPIGVLNRGVYQVARGHQLSEGGMLISTTESLKVHERVVVTLVMPGGDNVVARGEIIYMNPGEGGRPHYGVKFTELPLPTRRLIRNYVAAKTQAEAESEGH